MTSFLQNSALVLLSCLAASSVRSQILDAKTELNLGIAAYQEGKSEEAIQHLEHFVSTDSRPTIGHYYLGVVYDSMCAFPKPCDPRWAARAIQEYSKVLELEPAHKDALKSMAYLLYRIDRLDESESLYRKAVKLDPDDPEALYSTAVLDFRRTYRVRMQERARLHLARKQALIGLPICDSIRAKTLADVQEGVALLARTLEIVNDVDVKMYLAAFYNERAELQCRDRLGYELDLKFERQWWDRACVTWHDPQRSVRPRWIAAPPPAPPKPGDTCKW